MEKMCAVCECDEEYGGKAGRDSEFLDCADSKVLLWRELGFVVWESGCCLTCREGRRMGGRDGMGEGLAVWKLGGFVKSHIPYILATLPYSNLPYSPYVFLNRESIL